MSHIWHALYVHWYDHDAAGNTIRATLYGMAADRIVRYA